MQSIASQTMWACSLSAIALHGFNLMGNQPFFVTYSSVIPAELLETQSSGALQLMPPGQFWLLDKLSILPLYLTIIKSVCLCMQYESDVCRAWMA